MNTERMFPIQGDIDAKPFPTRIPWSIAELAYSGYMSRFGSDQSLEALASRGGFHPKEMDRFLPDWRERCDRLVELEIVVGLLLDSIGNDILATQFFDRRVLDRAKAAIKYSSQPPAAEESEKR